MSLKRTPLSPTTANRKKSRAKADDVFGDLSSQKVSAAAASPFLPLESVYKAGDRSLLFDIKDHVHYSQHNVDPELYYKYGVALNQGEMWFDILREDTMPRVTTGFASLRLRDFACAYDPFRRLYQALDLHGRVVNTWETQYDPLVGQLPSHGDKFVFTQEFRSLFTLGSSPKGKYIRFEECGIGRWVEIWLPHGSLYTLSIHGAGADRPRDKHGHAVKTAIADANGVRYLEHAVFDGHNTHAHFYEWKAQQGCTNDQVLRDLHGALEPSVVVNCYKNPPFPTKSQIGSIKCQKMSNKEKSRLASFAQHGQWPLDTPYDAEIEYGHEGICSEFHPDAPPGLSADSFYCSLCDIILTYPRPSTGRMNVEVHMRCNLHAQCKAVGSREEYDRRNEVAQKQRALEQLGDEDIVMGDKHDSVYCRKCKKYFRVFFDSGDNKRRGKGARSLFNFTNIKKHSKNMH